MIADERRSQVRNRLSAGGNEIRTIGPARPDRYFKDRLMAPLPDFPLRESRRERDTETDQNAGTFRGTECSNPPPSSRQSVSLPQPLWKVENPAFRAGLGSWLGDRVSRDAPGFPLRANRRQYLCRAIFQYRSAAEVISENAAPVPTKLGLLGA